MIPESQIIIRLAVAALLGLIIGYERERKDHDAGLRTHMTLVMGAALAMSLSINLGFWLGTQNPAGDPARIAAQVVSGIGFLGAGVIFRSGINIRGLTTAASLWTVAIIGLVIGAGLYIAGVTATIILLLILTALNYIEDHFLPRFDRVHVLVEANYREGLVAEVKQILEQANREVGQLGIERNLEEGIIKLNVDARILKRDSEEHFVNTLARIPGVNQVKLSG